MNDAKNNGSCLKKEKTDTFEELLCDIEINTERKAFLAAYEDRKVRNARPFGDTVRLVRVVFQNEDGCARIEVDIDGIRKTADTDKDDVYFWGLLGRTLYVSGIKVKAEPYEKWYIISCNDVSNRIDIISGSDLSEEEKKRFQKSVEQFTPNIQNDLARRRIQMSRLETEVPEKDERVLYKEVEEMNALYNIIKPIIAPEFREAFELCQLKLKKHASSSEKENYMKVMQEILEFDWYNNHRYTKIDIRNVSDYLDRKHIGHKKQLDAILTELKASNISEKSPKTFCLIGRSGVGSTSLAVSIAEALNKKYTIIDFSGVHIKESEILSGSSKMYSNGRVGLIFEKLKEVGTYGVLIFDNIDKYDPNVYSIVASIIESSFFQDEFMEIKIDLSNMFVIATANSVRDIPMSLRTHMNEIYLHDLDKGEISEIINRVMVPKYCNEFGLKFKRNIPEDICRKLIYRYSNMDMHKLDGVIRSIAVKTVTAGKKSFPDYSIKDLDELDFDKNNYMRIKHEYVTEITAVENKLWTCFDEYPEIIQKKAIELLDILRFDTDEAKRTYARNALHYIVNIFMEPITDYEPGAVSKELEKTHYLQADFRSMIETYILSKKLEQKPSGMIVLGLEGAAGTGKTTTAKSIAAAMGRQCVKINAGGADGSVLIKGVNKIVDNASPSMLIQELAKTGCGSYSSVFVLDEIDKATVGFYSSLYEFLDPNEDYYYDEYLECKIPKNNFIVILTFNEIDRIPLPIRDRMHIVRYDSYSLQDKQNIISRYIVKRLEDKFRMDSLIIEPKALEFYVNNYDVYPGMRDAERDLEYVLMNIAGINHGNLEKKVVITTEEIRMFLGESRNINDVPRAAMQKAGVAQALAVSGGIGSCFSVETIVNPYQKKNIVITGLPENSCLDSITVACSVACRYFSYELPKLHLHMTDASRKDGPSAGVAICMSIISCISKKGLQNCAFTGSIDIHGNIGAVGMVFEKLIAAERLGVEKVFIPKENYESLRDKGQLERLNVKVIPVEKMTDVVNKVWRRGE